MTNDPRDGSVTRAPGLPADRLDRVVKGFRPALSWTQVRDLVARGKVAIDGRPATDPATPVAGGATVVIQIAARAGAAAGQATGGAAASAGPAVPPFARERVVHVDRHVVVVDKPPGLDSVPWGEATDALDARLQALLGGRIRVVHRLDRDTSGLLMFARSEVAEQRLAHQLRRHSVHRRYLALAHGAVRAQTLRSFLCDDRGDGLRGSTHNQKLGKEAITHIEPVEALRGATLVACRLETGRTHQIRIHLAEAGHMLLGERGYVRDHLGPVLPAPRILLHAAELGFVHPDTETPLRFALPLPDDMAAVCAQLRA